MILFHWFLSCPFYTTILWISLSTHSLHDNSLYHTWCFSTISAWSFTQICCMPTFTHFPDWRLYQTVHYLCYCMSVCEYCRAACLWCSVLSLWVLSPLLPGSTQSPHKVVYLLMVSHIQTTLTKHWLGNTGKRFLCAALKMMCKKWSDWDTGIHVIC